MGACYSKAGHDFSIISRHKAPKDKNKNPSNGNGKPSGVKKERIRNGSLTLNFPVSCSNGVKEQTDTRDSDSDVCSLCKLGGNEDRDSDVCSLCKLGGNEDRDSESRVSSPHGEDNVVTSDSGIGSFLPPEESLEPIETAITPVDEIDSKTDCELSDDTVWKLRTDITNGESYLSSPCGNDRAKWLHKAGECKTHLLSPQSKRNSDVIIIKRGKNRNSKSDQKLRLSLNSTDSLDWTQLLTTSLDRTQSQASEMFYDELSIHAPLAQFDSIDFLLSNTDLLSKNSCTNSYVDYSTDTFQFKFDFSGLEVKRGEGCVVEECEGVEDSDSGAENKCSGKSVDLENGNRDSYTPTLEPSDISLTDLRHCDSETSLDLQLPSILPHLSEIRTMKLDGQDVVVIDVESFTQIMDEVSLLKQKLSQLTSVILQFNAQLNMYSSITDRGIEIYKMNM
ncbi:hypothetical protein ScPMuIL_002407 [Solemya velum]